MGLVQLPTAKVYWKHDELYGGYVVADVMPRDRFLMLDRCLHAANNEEDDRTDNLFKIRRI